MGNKIKLKIDEGFLFKPYAAPCSPDKGHIIRSGWIPDRTPAMQAAFDKMRAEPGDVPDRLLWLRVESDEGKRLAAKRRPWPGWMVVGPRSDKAIGKACRALFVAMNPDIDRQVILAGKRSGPKPVHPPDGDYVFEGGVMRAVMEEKKDATT